jgi:hypothetical protein
MILREAFGKMIDFINSKIENEDAKITYIPWDFKKASKKCVDSVVLNMTYLFIPLILI